MEPVSTSSMESIREDISKIHQKSTTISTPMNNNKNQYTDKLDHLESAYLLFIQLNYLYKPLSTVKPDSGDSFDAFRPFFAM